MTDEQLKKIDFAVYMAVANSPLYSEAVRLDAQNQAITIGMQLGYYPMEPERQSEAAKAFISGPEDLSAGFTLK
ncbi:MAG: hypothetical protein K2J20_00105 [Bacilli bacterium]|nr:hypothetical protein [Bacilli bacterium]